MWALQKARELEDTTFNASDNWILIFKRRHSLCSRKITKLITQREIEDSDVINNSANNFAAKIKKLLPDYQQSNVINTDQSGLELEMVGNRILSFNPLSLSGIYISHLDTFQIFEFLRILQKYFQ